MKKSMVTTLKKVDNSAQIFGIRINGSSYEEVLDLATDRLEKGQKTFVVTPNPEFMVYALDHPWFKKILSTADLVVPDGVGLVWAGKLLGFSLQERVSGTDLMSSLSQQAYQHGWSIYLLGGAGGVVKKTAKKIKESFRNRGSKVRIWTDEGGMLRLEEVNGRLGPRQEVEKIIKRINEKSPDLLFVAFGMGKQEKFIWENWGKLNVKLAMGVGGAFDYLSGRIPRAPVWLRKRGLEWLYRLIHQPWRIRRQMSLLKFVWFVLLEKFS